MGVMVSEWKAGKSIEASIKGPLVVIHYIESKESQQRLQAEFFGLFSGVKVAVNRKYTRNYYKQTFDITADAFPLMSRLQTQLSELGLLLYQADISGPGGH